MNNGIFKSILINNKREFVHILCGLFSQDISITSYEKMEFQIKDSYFLRKTRINLLKCLYCSNNKGEIFKCNKIKCNIACHIYCGLKEQISKNKNKVNFNFNCEKNDNFLLFFNEKNKNFINKIKIKKEELLALEKKYKPINFFNGEIKTETNINEKNEK